MQLDYRLTAADQRILVDRVRTGFATGGAVRLLWISAIAAALGGWGLARLGASEEPDWQAAELFFVAGLFAVTFLVELTWRRFGPLDRWLDRSAGDYSLSVTAAGLARSRDGQSVFLPWPDLRGFEETPQHWILYPRAGRGLVVPKSALADTGERERFTAEIRQSWTEHAGNRGRTLPERPPSSPLPGRMLRDLTENLRAGYRLAVFRPLDATAFRADAAQLTALLLLQLLLFGLADFLLAGEGARFNAYGLTDFSAGALLFLLAGVAMVGGLAESGSLPRLLVALAAARGVVYPIYFTLFAAAEKLPDPWAGLVSQALYLAWVLWMLAIVLRGLVSLCGFPWAGALLPASLYALFNLALAHGLPEENLFASGADASLASDKKASMDAEDLFYRQPALLEQWTEKLAADRVGVTDLYFLGFAGEADDKVFAHEIEYVKDLFDRRFGTAERSLILVNSLETAQRLPLANTHNLDAALQKLARRMNRKEDVLFLFLSSHGSADHHLSVRFPDLPLNDLAAARLKELLDASGIRHRVIVVSACYSGGFLDVLKDDYSLILTAASRDRPSFGCGTEADFTYFGSAYFVEALNANRSFVGAFEQARSRIQQREMSEGKAPSLPQVHVGPFILPKLRQLELRSKL